MDGLLLQRSDVGRSTGSPHENGDPARCQLTRRWRSLLFAWKAVQHVKSNAIVLAQGKRTVGIGGGLPSRVDAAELAIKKGGGRDHQCGDGLRCLSSPFPTASSSRQERWRDLRHSARRIDS